ncbi:MAG TPA: zf-HC2 domain-containing protein [Vicinamibacterales bacterium]|nr:zf-HC2 domain-containing protein [Vicinamibacterales bacterium]
MTCEAARERLQDQIDGTIDPAAVRELDRHLAGCASCRGLAADLAAVSDAAAALEPIAAPDHVWLQLAGRWRREHGAGARVPLARPRRGYAGFHVLAAAAVLAVAIGGGWIAWRATGTGDPEVLLERSAGAGNVAPSVLVETAQKDIEAADELYTSAIAVLEQVAASQKDLLAPEVAAMLDKNLEVIDEAIVESRAAVRSQPQSVEARESLFDTLRKKVALLQNTISLVSEVSRGNQAGASRLAGS